MDIIVALSVMAFGMGFGMAQRTNIIAAAVPTAEVGIASSVLALARNIAGAFGIAVFGTLLQNATNSNVLEISRWSAFHGNTMQQYGQFVGLISLRAQIDAYHTVFLWSAIIILVGAVMALGIRDVVMRKDVTIHVEG